MRHDRRDFVRGAAGAALATLAPRSTASSTAEQTPGSAASSGVVRTGGSRLVPVVGSKYKVWTKKVGAGPIRLLTLHGGPGFGHVNPEDVRREGALIPRSRTHTPNGSHFSLYDDQQDYMGALTGFLKDVEEGRFVPDRRPRS
jgi:hypothetical protein